MVDEDGVRRVWLAWHKVAKARLAELQPQVGEQIGVKYLGTHDRGCGSYRVVSTVLNRRPPTWTGTARGHRQLVSTVATTGGAGGRDAVLSDRDSQGEC